MKEQLNRSGILLNERTIDAINRVPKISKINKIEPYERVDTTISNNAYFVKEQSTNCKFNSK